MKQGLGTFAGLTLCAMAMGVTNAATAAPAPRAVTVGSNGFANARTATNSAPARSAFCVANDELDRATADITSPSQAVPILKANQDLINQLEHNYPSGTIGNEARKVVQVARTVIATDSANALNSPAFQNGTTDMNTYCRVDSNGNPLPSYFGMGKQTSLCRNGAPLANNVAPSQPSASVAFLQTHRGTVNAFAASISTLPKDLRSDGRTLVSALRATISSGNPNPLETQAFETAAVAMNDYCGISG